MMMMTTMAAAGNAEQKHKKRFVCRKSIALWYARWPLIAKAKALAVTADRRHKKPISILSNRCAFFSNISSNSIVKATRSQDQPIGVCVFVPTLPDRIRRNSMGKCTIQLKGLKNSRKI